MAILVLNDEVRKFLNQQHASVIDGSSVAEGQLHPVIDPATEATIAQVLSADAGTVDKAVQSAHRAFRDGRWTGLRPADRERILLDFASKVAEHAETLAQIESLNQGKSIHVARMIDAGGSVEFMRYMAGWATKIEGRTMDVSIAMPPGARHTAYTRREPVGVVAGIVPWNFPLLIATWKLIPALAAGCTVVLKPSPETPLTALYLAQLALQAGIPPGVFNLVPGGVETGQALVAHPLVRKITFTGSTAAGRKVGISALENMARFTLELGGKNPMVVLEDADIGAAVQGALLGGLTNSGQVCAAASRFYVHRSRHQAFVEALAAAVAGMKVGPGLDPEANANPVVSRRQQQSIGHQLERARQEGARVLAGGGLVDQPGFYVQPTVLDGVNHQMAIAREEIFGPVLAVIPFDDDEQALAMANDSDYGLGASLWTNDLRKAMNLVPRIEAGTVWVNTHVLIDPAMPFGGVKQSGIGREFGGAAVESFTELKSVCIAH